MAKYLKIKGKVCLDTLRGMSRPFFGLLSQGKPPKNLFSLDVRPSMLWSYVQRVYGRTALGGKDVRPKGAWTYVHSPFERW